MLKLFWFSYVKNDSPIDEFSMNVLTRNDSPIDEFSINCGLKYSISILICDHSWMPILIFTKVIRSGKFCGF
jgi:hypothetical protein